MNLPRYVYVLDVAYPPDTGRPPATWEPEGPGQEFRWPVNRSYFSRSGARRRAKLLESYGATVAIIRSEPIVWKFP